MQIRRISFCRSCIACIVNNVWEIYSFERRVNLRLIPMIKVLEKEKKYTNEKTCNQNLIKAIAFLTFFRSFFFFFLSRSSIVVQDATLDTVKFYWSLICIDFLFGLSIGQTTWTVEIIFDFLLFLLARRIKKTNMDESKKENKKREKLKAVIICTDTYETRR